MVSDSIVIILSLSLHIFVCNLNSHAADIACIYLGFCICLFLLDKEQRYFQVFGFLYPNTEHDLGRRIQELCEADYLSTYSGNMLRLPGPGIQSVFKQSVLTLMSIR